MKNTSQELKEISRPFPQFIEDIISLYNINVPFFFAPLGFVQQFTDDDAVGTMVREPQGVGEPKFVLIAYDKFTEHWDKGALLMEILHEIGHLKLLEETDKIKRQQIKEYLECGLNHSSIKLSVQLAIENRVNDWARQEWKKLKPFVNAKRNGWKRGVKFEDIKEKITMYNF